MIDIHVHFFPSRVFQAIWNYFETESFGLWKVHYKVHGPEHVATLKQEGVERFTSLVYAHRPGMAHFLNEFVRESAQEIPELIPFGTIFAGDGNTAAVAQRIFEEYGFHGIKLHPFVSQEMLDDERFFPAYDVMEGMGKILLCHPGSGPVYLLKDGAERLRRVVKTFPKLKVIVAHCGAFEYDDYSALAEDFETIYFDTAMNCVHATVFQKNCPGRDFFLRFQDRILYGSDFPNIPYPYADQLAGLRSLELGPEIESKLFKLNAEKLITDTVTR